MAGRYFLNKTTFLYSFMVQVSFPKISLNRRKRIEVEMFKTPLKIVLAATIAMPAILAADLAYAGQRNNNRHHNAHNSYNHHNYNRGHRSHYRGHSSYNYGHSYNRHYRYSYYPSFYYGGYYGGHYRYNHGYHSNVGTYASLAALGLALGFIIHKSSKDKYQDDGTSQQQNYVPRQPYQGGNSSPQTGGGFDFSQCRDTRDYETTILIDGQEQVAYGTACMIEDGSWVAGPMRIDR